MPAMVLKDYLTSKNIEAEDFGNLIGVKSRSVIRYLEGERRPKPEIMQKIINVTNGLVTADDFYRKPDAPLVSERQASMVPTCDPSNCRMGKRSHKSPKSGSTKISPTRGRS